ncbi:MAG: hypothetical protein J5732_07375 [Bacteroidaceae bacterium]|nr:hypothetical protein [Bacteroidaceae bacterium]
MVKTLLIVVGMLLLGVALLSVGIWARQNGKFPDIHVGHNPVMRKRGIGCVEAQDAEARRPNPLAVDERINNINH